MGSPAPGQEWGFTHPGQDLIDLCSTLAVVPAEQAGWASPAHHLKFRIPWISIHTSHVASLFPNKPSPS